MPATRPVPIAALLTLLLGACAKPPAPPPAGTTLHLLARLPEASIQQPAAILPQGDLPHSGTWGSSDGGGWSRKLHEHAGQPYLQTNQPTASLLLPATHGAARPLALILWCAQRAGQPAAAPDAGGDETRAPVPVQVRLNGVALGTLEVTHVPALHTLETPAPAWERGDNALELEVAVQTVDGARAWDTLALASVSYGPAEPVVLDTRGESARFAARTGALYALELAGPARLELAGTSSGAGELRVRTGLLDRRTGKRTLVPGDPAVFPARAGQLAAWLPLKRHAGAVALLELEWSSPEGAELVLTRLDAHEEHASPRPPIVFVSIDTFAARHLSLYGYERATTPVLAELLREAVLFERCLTNAPWTLPSYLSVLSGLYPRAHDVALERQAGAEPDLFGSLYLAPNRWTLAEALRARGYRTAGFVDTFWLSPLYGLRQGFDEYNGQAALRDFTDVHAGIELIVSELLPPWLAGARDERPPFVFLHALDAHGPFWPEEPFQDTFVAQLGRERTLTPAGSVNQTYRAIPHWMGLTLWREEQGMPEELPLEEIVARYDETLLKVDAYLGKLFELLRARGLYDEAVIVISGDHGETFGPGVFGHGILREDVLHVPLIVKLPGGASGGKRVQAPVSLVDLYPTLMELAGVPPEPSHLHGTSLLRQLAEPPGERALYTECGWAEQYAITVGRWRLIEERPGSESAEYTLLTHPRVPAEWLAEHCPEVLAHPLTQARLDAWVARPDAPALLAELRQLLAGPFWTLYDLESDPEERHDLAAERPEVVQRLLPLLEAERARSRAARAEADPGVNRPQLGAEALDALQHLGYGSGPK